jgi:hypothetical protein
LFHRHLRMAPTAYRREFFLGAISDMRIRDDR